MVGNEWSITSWSCCWSLIFWNKCREFWKVKILQRSTKIFRQANYNITTTHNIVLIILFKRKNALILTNIFVISAAIFNIVAKFVKSYELIIASRFIGGIYVGLFSGVNTIIFYEFSCISKGNYIYIYDLFKRFCPYI